MSKLAIRMHDEIAGTLKDVNWEWGESQLSNNNNNNKNAIKKAVVTKTETMIMKENIFRTLEVGIGKKVLWVYKRKRDKDRGSKTERKRLCNHRKRFLHLLEREDL